MESADLIKLIVELPLAGVVIYAIHVLKPVLEKHLEQQRKQFDEMLKLVGEVVAGQKTLSAGQSALQHALEALSEGQEALKQALQAMGFRLDRVEEKVDELVEAEHAHEDQR